LPYKQINKPIKTIKTKMKQTKIYSELVQKMREFFLKKNFIEVPDGIRLSILAACENPHSIVPYCLTDENGEQIKYPLQQTNQMVLEEQLLQNPEWDGVFCITTSYRDEKTPIDGRHKKVFKMVEFEFKGTMKDLHKLEVELLEFLGFKTPVTVDYDKLCYEYETDILESNHEELMWRDLGSSISLQNFPLRTNPFWNMKEGENGKFNKIDVILYGQETFGSAERSCDPDRMREMFYTIEDGRYAGKLFELFGKERVEKELEEFLSHKFFSRVGGGIGMSRLLRAYELLLDEKKEMSVDL
jgi:aspartyl/asparaginyl-tRNA synthetase